MRSLKRYWGHPDTIASIHLVSKDRPPKTLIDLVKRGYLGVKSGRGFYDYSSQTVVEVLRNRDRKLIELIKFLKIPLCPSLAKGD